jgi:MFS transporter, DHA1 family, multidrug resistance protein
VAESAASTVASPEAHARLGLTLGAVSAVGPLSIDLYLPALPAMASELGAAPGDLQRTLSVFFLALALAQIPIGSLSDRVGRKPVLYAGFSLFVVATLGCAASPSVGALLVLRFLQGFAICAGTVVSRAMIRDVTSGPAAARLMATSFLIIGISPVVAPFLGSHLLSFMSWRGLFVALAVAGVAGLLLARFALAESLPPAKRLPRGTPVIPAYVALLRNGRFLRGALVTGLATTIPFAYITAAPFVLTGRYALDSRAYSVLLGINAICSIGMMQLAPSLMRRWGAKPLLVRTTGAGVVLCAGLGAALWAGVLDLPIFQSVSMAIFMLAGIALTPAAVSALDASGSGGGTAAATLGSVQLAVTATASGIISLFPAVSVLPLLVILGGSFLGAFVLSSRAPASGH